MSFFLKILHNDTIKKGSLFTIYSFVNNVIAFVLLIILARFLTPEDYGNLNLFNTLITFTSVFICLNTAGYVGPSYFKFTKVYAKRVLGNVLLISGLIYLFVIFVLIIFEDYFCEFIGISLPYQIMAVSISCLLVIYNLRLDTLRIEERIISYGKYSMSYALVNCCLTIFLIVGLGYNWLGRVYSYLTVVLIFGILCTYHLKKDNWLSNPTNKEGVLIDMLKWGVPLIPHSLSFWLRQGADRYIINAFYSTEEVGLFSFMLNISSVIAMVGHAFNTTNSVYIYKTLSGDKNAVKNLHSHNRMIFIFFLLGTMLYGFICYFLVPIAFKQYSDAINYLIPLLISAFFQCVYLLFTNYLFYYSKTKELMFITFSCSLIQVLFSVLFTKYSLYYTAIASVISSFLTALFVFIQATRILNEKC